MEEKKLNYELIDYEGKNYEFLLTDAEDDFNIVFNYEDVDVDVSYDEGTDVPYGSTMVCYEPAGYYCDGQHSDPEIKFFYWGDEVSKEDFLDELFKQLETTEEDFEEVLKEMKEEADEKFMDYVNDHIDEYVPEPDYPDPDDYDWRY